MERAIFSCDFVHATQNNTFDGLFSYAFWVSLYNHSEISLKIQFISFERYEYTDKRLTISICKFVIFFSFGALTDALIFFCLIVLQQH